jgi:hypothetical protein
VSLPWAERSSGVVSAFHRGDWRYGSREIESRQGIGREAFIKDAIFSHQTQFFQFLKNESYQIFMNICKANLAYFKVFIKKLAQNDCQKTCPTKQY